MSQVHVGKESVPGSGFGLGLRVGWNGSIGTSETTLPNMPALKFCEVQADSANSAIVYLGVPGAASSGIALAAGQSIRLPVDNLDCIALVAASGTQAVRYLVL